MKFLNCNYPDKCKIPKGKPKIKAWIELKTPEAHLIAETINRVWIECERGYWYGIEFDIKSNGFDRVNIFETIGAINIAMMDWENEVLESSQEDILRKYLKIIS